MTSRSRRPYLIRAIYDWASDNGYTPHMLVAADYPGVIVPREFVQEGRITLNISPMAVQNLDLKAEPIWFSARFSGKSFDIQVPTGAVLAVFARENGEGIVFGEIEPPQPGGKEGGGDAEKPKPKSGRPQLRIVK
jgi:stringent starvation protein B